MLPGSGRWSAASLTTAGSKLSSMASPVHAPGAKSANRPPGRTQAERSESTIQELVSTARELFSSKGFADTSIEDLVRAAGVTRGALYHHFENKTDVFRAVVEAEASALARSLLGAAERKRDSWRQLEAGCLAYLDECTDPQMQQILLLDGPAVLGWEGLREIEGRYTMAMLKRALHTAMEDGKLRARPPDPLAYALFGAMAELGMMVAREPDQEAAKRAARRELQALLRAIAGS